MSDYKKLAEELMVENLKTKHRLDALEADNKQLRQIVGILLDRRPAMVLREDDLELAPPVELFANMSGEAVIRVRR